MFVPELTPTGSWKVTVSALAMLGVNVRKAPSVEDTGEQDRSKFNRSVKVHHIPSFLADYVTSSRWS